MEKFTCVNYMSECGPLKCTLKLHFSNLTTPGIKLICGLSFSSFYRDTHFQDFEDLFSFRYKIKFAKCHFGSQKTYFEYTCNVSFLLSISRICELLLQILTLANDSIHCWTTTWQRSRRKYSERLHGQMKAFIGQRSECVSCPCTDVFQGLLTPPHAHTHTHTLCWEMVIPATLGILLRSISC